MLLQLRKGMPVPWTALASLSMTFKKLLGRLLIKR